MGELLQRRRASAEERLARLGAELGPALPVVDGKACVYVTGSFGRGEASSHSDLDLFTVGQLQAPGLVQLDGMLLNAAQRLGFPEFAGDAEYLKHHTVDALVGTLGKPDDDATNTFTARLLMLLESRPLLEEAVYQATIRNVIGAYWRDYHDHKEE